MCTIGNYDYGFYYHLMQDGTLEMEVRLSSRLLSLSSSLPISFPFLAWIHPSECSLTAV